MSYSTVSPSSSQSPLPFIKSLFPRRFLLFAAKSLELIGGKEKNIGEVQTSCIATFSALSVIFSGTQRAKELFGRINFTSSWSSLVSHQGKRDFYRYKVQDLFSGRAIDETNSYPIERRKELFLELCKKYVKEFNDYTNPGIKQCFENQEESEQQIVQKIERFLTHLDFPFQRPVIKSMQRNIDNNIHALSPKASFIYYVVLLRNDKYIQHAFVIEQFYDANKKHGLYHLYQSSIGRMTLEDYLSNKKNEVFEYEEIKQFLRNLDQLLLNRNGKGIEERFALNKLHKKVFGLDPPRDEHPPLFYKKQERVLGGISLRYQWDEINPFECEQHYVEFIESEWANKISSFPRAFIENLFPADYYHFVQRTTELIMGWKADIEAAKTGCMFNFTALSVILSGTNRAKELCKLMLSSFALRITDNNSYDYTIRNLFSGRFILELAPSSSLQESWNEKGETYAQELSDYIEKKEEQNIEKVLSNLNYPFNEKVIDSLRKKLLHNVRALNEKTAFIYYIVIYGEEAETYHGLVIEQAFLPQSQEGVYQVYQSWAGKMSLEEFLSSKKRGYSLSKIEDFLNDLNFLLLNRPGRSIESSEELKACHQRCFGVEVDPKAFPRFSYDPKEKVFRGPSLRYICDQINPYDCSKNYYDFNHL